MDRPGNNGLPDDGAREASQEAARAVAAASAQMDLALREAEGPVGQLGADVERMIAALEQLKASPATASAPELDALQLRLLPQYKGVPLLVLTTEASTERKMEGKQAGATGWIVKPFNPDRLLETVSRVLA